MTELNSTRDDKDLGGKDTTGGNWNVKIVEDQDGRGNGLVAARDFKPGEVVCRYSDRYIPTKEMKDESADTFKYRYDVNDGHYLRNVNYHGFYVNDAAPARFIADLHTCFTISEITDWACEYAARILLLKKKGVVNAHFIESMRDSVKCLEVVALCDIKAGNDILTSYGDQYWTSMISLDPKAETLTRVAAICWAATRGVFPSFGVVNKLLAIVIPVLGDDGYPASVTVGALTSSAKSIKSEVDGIDKIGKLCGAWLAALGVKNISTDALSNVGAWFDFCGAVGTSALRQSDMTAAY